MTLDALRRLAPGTASILIVLVLWELVSSLRLVNPILLPAPSAIVGTLAGIVASGAIVPPASHTLGLLLVGYVIACVLGVAVGIAMGWSESVHRLLAPLIELFRPIPKPALIPPLFLFLGIGLKTMIFIVALAAFFPVVINTIQGVRGIDPTLIATARTFRLSRATTVLKIVLPAALPMILTGMRVSLGLALILVTVAEVIAGESGIGYMIMDKQQAYQIRPMYAWLVLLALLGFTLNAAFEEAEKRIVPWRGH